MNDIVLTLVILITCGGLAVFDRLLGRPKPLAEWVVLAAVALIVMTGCTPRYCTQEEIARQTEVAQKDGQATTAHLARS